MSFERPGLVPLAIVCVIAGIAAFAYIARGRSRAALRYSNLAFLIEAARPPRFALAVLAAVWIAAMLLLGASLAGMQVRAPVPVRDGAVVFCIDTSGSMATADVAPTRAQAAAAAMGRFVDAAPPGVAAGIVAFASSAQTIAAPTRDRERIRTALGQIPPPNGATAIGDALLLARSLVPAHGKRIVILITDGENNAGSDPMEAAAALKRAGVIVYAVGIGTNSGALVPGTLQEAGLDDDALRSYASITGGTYSRASDAAGLQRALAALGRTASFESRNVDLTQGAAVAAAVLAAMAFLSGAWTRSI